MKQKYIKVQGGYKIRNILPYFALKYTKICLENIIKTAIPLWFANHFKSARKYAVKNCMAHIFANSLDVKA